MTKETITETATKVAEKTLSEAGAQLATTANDILDATSKAFPELAGKSFEFYAHYIFATGVGEVVAGLLCFAILGFALYLSVRLWRYIAKNAENDNLDENSVPFIMMGTVLLLCVMAVSLFEGVHSIQTGIVKVIAPEGAVINEIIRNIK